MVNWTMISRFTIPEPRYRLATYSLVRNAPSMAGGFIKEVLEKDDACFDASLRPTVFRDFVGQERLKERLQLLIEAARQRKEPLNQDRKSVV